MQTLKKVIWRISEEILVFLFPPICPGCGVRGESACTKCMLSLESMPTALEHGGYALLPYRNKVVRQALWLLKYHNRQDIAVLLGEKLYEAICEMESDEALFSKTQTMYIVPIPVSKKRLKERGYNQAGLIARAMLFADTGNRFALLEDVLIKNTHTPRQAHLKSRSARLKNIKGSFSVTDPEKVRGKRIILIDDITTTGATLSEAVKVLRAAGATDVTCWAVAH